MDVPETLALARAKQESQRLSPGRVKLVPSECLAGTAGDARIRGTAGAA